MDYKTAILNFKWLNAELFNILNNNLVFNKNNIFIVSVKMYLQGKYNLKTMFDIYTESTIVNFIQFKLIYPENNIISFFQSKENIYYAYLKQFLMNQKKDQSLMVDIFYNYFKEKFNIESDDECAQLIGAIQFFVRD